MTRRNIKDMTEADLQTWMNLLMDATRNSMPDGVAGFMLVVVDTDGVCQFASTLDPDLNVMPHMLRELAMRLETQDYIRRS